MGGKKGGKEMLRVAAYGRVPDQKDAKLTVRAGLIQRFVSLIAEQEEWHFSGVYVDIGNGHSRLNEMLDNCRYGSIDLILASSMNALALRKDDLFKTLKEMNDLGVTINFIDDNLSTRGGSGEQLLSTLASFLKPPKPPKVIPAPYGIGDEEEAAAVRRIFSLFLQGHGRSPIAAVLNEEGIPGPKGSAWNYCDIRRILSDPVYKDEGVIDEETWCKTGIEAEKRKSIYGYRQPSSSPFAGLITCGICGNTFRHRERGKLTNWVCKKYLKHGPAGCPSKCIREKTLISILSDARVDICDIDNITIWPDGGMVINTNTGDINTQWR